jgi:hypothetical protein
VPFGTSETIRKAVKELLASRPAGEDGGFVIFSNEDGDFVQFALVPGGLYLFWPQESDVKADRVAGLLRASSFAEDPSGDIGGLRDGQFVAGDDGVYAQFGRNVERVETFTLRAFGELFGSGTEGLEAELELE